MQITVFGAKDRHDLTPADLSAQLKSGDGTIWVDMTGPTEEDVRIMEQVFGFHPLAIEDTSNQQQRPKIEEYDDHWFIILNPVAMSRQELFFTETTPMGRKRSEESRVSLLDVDFHELDVFVGHNYVVTVHKDNERVIEETRRRCGRGHLPMSAGYLLYLLLDVAVDSYFPVLDAIGEEIDELENLILATPRQETLNRLFALKRRLNEVWRAASQQRDMFNIFTRRDLTFIDYESLQYHLRDVYDHLLRITDMSGTFRDLLTSMVDLYMTAVSNRLNMVVNRLTIITVASGAMAVITGFYGMNFLHTWPPFDSPWGVPIVLVIMVLVISLMVYTVRRLKWF
jgi:magnesium transporter